VTKENPGDSGIVYDIRRVVRDRMRFQRADPIPPRRHRDTEKGIWDGGAIGG